MRHLAIFGAIFAVSACGTSHTGSPEGGQVAAGDKKPTSQQQVQDHVLDMFQRTVNGLGPGSKLDTTRYGRGATDTCDDLDQRPEAPVHFLQFSDMEVPTTDYTAILTKIGHMWTSFGWKVIDKGISSQPHPFATDDDGYTIQALITDPGYSPSVLGESPCFDGRLLDRGIQFPRVVQYRDAA